jgi:hypothetical protein
MLDPHRLLRVCNRAHFSPSLSRFMFPGHWTSEYFRSGEQDRHYSLDANEEGSKNLQPGFESRRSAGIRSHRSNPSEYRLRRSCFRTYFRSSLFPAPETAFSHIQILVHVESHRVSLRLLTGYPELWDTCSARAEGDLHPAYPCIS